MAAGESSDLKRKGLEQEAALGLIGDACREHMLEGGGACLISTVLGS